MRVLIELLDKHPIENILGTCVFKPEIVVFLCDVNESSMQNETSIYRLLRRRKIKTTPRFYYFNTGSTTEIRRVLAAVVRDYPGCVFDYTGGHDLVLLQAGAYCLPLGIPGYYIDIKAGRFMNVQHCAYLAESFAMPSFSVEDVFTLTGAALKGSGHFNGKELENEEFEKDVLAVWPIVLRSTRAWGQFVAYLQACCAGSPLTTLDASGSTHVKSGRHPAKYHYAIFEKLYKLGLLTRFKDEGKQVKFTFKSSLIKKCLLNQGVWLELYCYVEAKRSGLFDDVRTSVVVDWAGPNGGSDSTKNEVDVVLVKGVTPIFVSCKMSAPTPLALSEIRLLSGKFGGVLSRTAVLTADTLGAENKALKTRAADLDILLLDQAALQAGDLAGQLLRTVQRNKPEKK